MKVLRTEGSDQEDWVPCLCTHRGQPYAILSHRWFEDPNHEILFSDIQEIDQTVFGTGKNSYVVSIKNSQYADGTASSNPGFKKLQGAARQALKDGYDYIWIDTCCIDKNSSAELSEAVNSMFKWYKASRVCYAYLMDVSDGQDTSEGSSFATSQWWKRGWTLQELLAPSEVKFFTSEWKAIGNNRRLGTKIAGYTGISVDFFKGSHGLYRFSIAQRMSWASGRITTRPEDIAYCLMGLFDVNMPVLYGEGQEKAFVRLQQEIMKDSDDESIFAWRDEPAILSYSGMLATRPAAFAGSQNVYQMLGGNRKTPYLMTNKGLSISLPLLSSYSSKGDDTLLAVLGCGTHPKAETVVGIFLRKLSGQSDQYVRRYTQRWIEDVSDKDYKEKQIYVLQRI